MNVCIYRLPISKSIVHPRSMCPECGNMIKFYDNIPILSYIWLKARCRYCHKKISLRYPMIELISGLFAVCVAIKFGFTLEGFVYYAFISTLLVITFIDIDHQIIPDIISLPGIPVFFLASFAIPDMTWREALLGIIIGGGSLWAVAQGYYLITKKEGMGGGDVKLLAMIGALIGWKGVIFTVFVSSVLGTLTGVIVMVYARKDMMKEPIPYGPFLAIAAMIFVFFGPVAVVWYFNMRY